MRPIPPRGAPRLGTAVPLRALVLAGLAAFVLRSSPAEAVFQYRKSITIQNGQVSGTADLLDFPVLIKIDLDADLQSHVTSPAGFDIQFRAADGVRILDHEIERYDGATGSLQAWVRVPVLDHDDDTVLYIYYGDPSITCSSENPQGVWSSGYRAVWHLGESGTGAAGEYEDSTRHRNHGQGGGGNAGLVPNPVAAHVEDGQDFEGDLADDHIRVPNSSTLENLQEGDFSVQAWFRPDGTPPGTGSDPDAYYAIAIKPGLHVGIEYTFQNRFEMVHVLSDNSIPLAQSGFFTPDVFYHVVGTVSRTNGEVKIYVDGQLRHTNTFTPGMAAREYGTLPWRIGIADPGAPIWRWPANGQIDEVRFSAVTLSSDWIQTEYSNQISPATFHLQGLEETTPSHFTEVSVAAGLNTGNNKDGGVSWGDFNGDGHLDLAVNTLGDFVGARTRLYLSDGALPNPAFTDVTACLAPGLEASLAERAVAWGDIDNDGDLDLMRTSSSGIQIYKNNGPGADCLGWSLFGAAGSPTQTLALNGEGIGLLDYDQDGDLDLVADAAGDITLFDNDGLGTFTSVPSGTSGLPAGVGANGDYVAVADFDVDGDVDFIDRRETIPDLWINAGSAPYFSAGGFDQIASNSNKGGAAFCDFDSDGDFDLFWTDNDTNQIWEQTGYASGSLSAKGAPTGIAGDIDGVACGDLDNDGDLDLVLTSDGNDHLFRNDGAFSFTEIAPGGFGAADGEGTALADYDRDGDLDVLINQDGGNQLWRNQTDNNNYLMVRALADLGGGVTRDAIGATINLLDCRGNEVAGIREVNGGRGHGSQDPAYVHFGLPSCGDPVGPNGSYLVWVRFPGGAVVTKAVVPSSLGSYQLLEVRDTDAIDTSACTTAVTLASFEAKGADGAVELEWRTASEIDNLGFRLHRSNAAGGPYEVVTPRPIPGLGSSPAGAEYRYRDEGLENGGTYFYRLEDIDATGGTTLHGPVSATPSAGALSAPHLPPAALSFGNPEGGGFSIAELGEGAILELRVEGFDAEVRGDGTVGIEIPGLSTSEDPGALSVPVKRAWVAAPPGRRARIASVEERELEVFTGLRPGAVGAPEIVGTDRGAFRQRRSRAPAGSGKASRGFLPAEAARIVETAFQGEAKKVLLEISPLRWNESRGELRLARSVRVHLAFEGVDGSEQSIAPGRGRRRPSLRRARRGSEARSNIRLVVRAPGLYAIRFEEIPRGPSYRSLRLSHRGETVAHHIEPRTRPFGPGSTLYFLSEQAQANPYGPETVYELEWGAAGRAMPVEDAPPSGDPVSYFWHREEREEDRHYQAGLVNAEDLWLGETLFAPERKSFPFQVSSPAASAPPARLKVDLQGVSDLPGSPDHHVRVYVNGAFLKETSWNGKQARSVEGEIPGRVLEEGENLLEIENAGDAGVPYSMVMLDRFEVTYARKATALSGTLRGTFGESGVAEVRDVGPGAAVLDVSGSTPRWLAGARVAGPSTLNFSVRAGGEYLVVDRGALLRPEPRPMPPQELAKAANQADYLLIGPRELLAAAEPLLRLRRGQGLSARAVAVEDVYSEFGFGESRPEAIRAFLAHAYHDWRPPSPRYVLLFGDASYDFRDVLGTGVENRVPPLLVRTTHLWTASDPLYAAVNGDDRLADLAIGRLPVASQEEARAVVEKILAYESAVPDEGQVVIVADDSDAAGDFEADAEALASGVLAGERLRRIFLSRLGSGATREAIREAFREDTHLLSYVGHGGIHLWAEEDIFNVADVPALEPRARLPILLTMNCLNGYFHFPYFNSLAEEAVKSEAKGAIAAFSPSGFSHNGPAHLLHEAVLREILHGGHERLGDALMSAAASYADSGALPELLTLYHLLGDPALRLGRTAP